MLYKQAWQELKDYIKIVKVTDAPWNSPVESAMRVNIQAKIKQLEKRWKIIPEKKGENYGLCNRNTKD